MKKFLFNGDWETKLQVQAFAGFLDRQSDIVNWDKGVPSDGTVKLCFIDDLGDDPDPLPQQIEAVNYLLEHQERIAEVICERVKAEYPDIMRNFGLEDFDEEEGFPKIKSNEDVKKAIGFSTIYVAMAHKDGIAYLGYGFGCKWDEEHGYGLVMHKDEITESGDSACAYVTRDEDQERSVEDARKKAKFYQPHPKYGKLKPSQQFENKMYEFRLIENGHNDEFKQLVESGKLDVNHEISGWRMTFLAKATQCNNEEIALFILSKKPNEVQSALQSAVLYRNKAIVEALVEQGASLNKGDKNSLATPIYLLVDRMIHAYIYGAEGQKQELWERDKDMLRWLIEKGASPSQAGQQGRTAFDKLSICPEELRDELTLVLKTMPPAPPLEHDVAEVFHELEKEVKSGFWQSIKRIFNLN